MRGDRIKALRKELGWNQSDLAAVLDVSRSTVSMWEIGASDTPLPMLQTLAETLRTSPAYLMGITDDPTDYDNDDLSDVRQELIDYFNGDARKIRQFLKAEEDDARRDAGPFPSNVRPISGLHHQRIPLIGSAAAGEPIYDPEELDVYVDSPVDADAAITIRGDSMIPAYQDGDLVYIKCCPDVPEGAVAVVFLSDEATLKHVYKRPTGLTLISDNPAHPPLLVEFADYNRVRVFGVPVGFTRIYKSDPLRKIKKGF